MTKQEYIVVVNIEDLNDSYAATTLEDAIELASFDPGTEYYINRVNAYDRGAARLRCMWDSDDSDCIGIGTQ